MSINKVEVGKRIFTIRKSLGLTMKEFGERLGKPIASDSIVSRWEKGKSLPNNERLKKIAELGETTVEYLLNGREVRDLAGNIMPEGLRFFKYEFIGHHKIELKDSPVRIIYSFIKISKDDIFYYCGIRSSVVLGNIDISSRNAAITILSDNLEKNEFFNSVNSIKYDFESDSPPFVNFDNYRRNISLGNKKSGINLLNDLLNEILNKLKQDNKITFKDIDFKGTFHYFEYNTTKTITLIIGN